MPTFTTALPATRATGDTPTGGPAADVNALTAALAEIRAAGLTSIPEVQALITTALDALKAGAPAAYDTLVEVATELARGANAEAALLTAIGQRYTLPPGGVPAGDLASAVQARLTDARTPTDAGTAALLTTAGTAARAAVQADIATAIDALKSGAPAAYDTLVEVANELARGASAETALTNAIAAKATKPAGGFAPADLDLPALAADPVINEAFGRGVSAGKLALAVGVPDAAPLTLYSTQNPAAEYDPVTNRTYLAFLGGMRRLYVTAFDHAAAQWLEPVYVGPYYTAVDDNHGAPSLTIDQNARRVVVTWGTHGEAQPFARSGAECDIRTWSTVRSSMGATYVSLTYDTVSKALFAMLRSGNGHGQTYPCHEYGTMLRSTDGGLTWTDLGGSTSGLVNTKAAFPDDAATDFYGTDCDARDGRVYVSWAIAHGTRHDGPRYGAHVAYYDTTDGLMHAVDGTSLGASIDTAAKMTACRILAQDYVYPVHTALSATTGAVLCAFNRYNTSTDLVEVTTALHTGVAGTGWTVTNTGITSNYLYHGVAPAWRDGRWEIACVRLLGGDRTVAQTSQQDTIGGASAGGDLVVLTSATGTTWAVDSVFDRNRFAGGGCMYTQTVRRAHPDLIMLAQPIGLGTVYSAISGGTEESGGQSSYNTPRWDAPIYAVHSRAVLPRLVGVGHRPDVLLRINPWYLVAENVTPPSDWTTVDLSAVVPRGTREVTMKVSITGKNTAGACVLSFRDASTTRNSDAQVSSRGEWTDEMVYDLVVPLSPDRAFSWKASAANVTVTLRPRALLIGSVVRAHTNAVADTTAPSVPTGVSVASGNAQATVSWTASSDNVAVTGYRVYRDGVLVGSPTATSFTDTGLSNGTSYAYTVRAVDAAGNLSAASSSVTAIPAAAADTQAPTTPGTPTATAGANSATASTSGSTDNVGVTGYRWYRGGSQVGSTTGTSFTESALPAGTAVTYTVAAIDAAGNLSAQSAASNAVTPTAPTRTETSSDGFTRADRTGGMGNGWAVMGSASETGAIISNQATALYATAAGTRYFRPATVPASANQYSRVQVTALSGTAATVHPQVGVRLSVSGTQATGYFTRYNPSTSHWELYKAVAGTATLLKASTTNVAVPAAGYYLDLEVDSTNTLRVRVDNTILTELTHTDTDSPVTQVGATALAFRSATATDDSQRVDNYSCGVLG